MYSKIFKLLLKTVFGDTFSNIRQLPTPFPNYYIIINSLGRNC